MEEQEMRTVTKNVGFTVGVKTVDEALAFVVSKLEAVGDIKEIHITPHDCEEDHEFYVVNVGGYVTEEVPASGQMGAMG